MRIEPPEPRQRIATQKQRFHCTACTGLDDLHNLLQGAIFGHKNDKRPGIPLRICCRPASIDRTHLIESKSMMVCELSAPVLTFIMRVKTACVEHERLIRRDVDA